MYPQKPFRSLSSFPRSVIETRRFVSISSSCFVRQSYRDSFETTCKLRRGRSTRTSSPVFMSVRHVRIGEKRNVARAHHWVVDRQHERVTNALVLFCNCSSCIRSEQISKRRSSRLSFLDHEIKCFWNRTPHLPTTLFTTSTSRTHVLLSHSRSNWTYAISDHTHRFLLRVESPPLCL